MAVDIASTIPLVAPIDGSIAKITVYTISADISRGNARATTQWYAYVSYNSRLPGHSLRHKTLHATTEAAARQQAECLLADWKAQAKCAPDAQPDIPIVKKKRNRTKYDNIQPVARNKRCNTQPDTYADVQHRSGNYKGRGKVVKPSEKPLSTLPLAAQVWELNVRLMHMRGMHMRGM